MSPPLRIETDRCGSGVVVRLDGEVDLATVPMLRRCLSDAVRGTSHVVVDLTGVAFVSCGGLGALLDAQQLAESRAGALRVVGECTRQVVRAFEVTGIGERIPVERAVPGAEAGCPAARVAV